MFPVITSKKLGVFPKYKNENASNLKINVLD